MAKLQNDSPRRQQILLKAAELFRTHGYANTGMRLIAEHLGVEAASLYNHIPGKSFLLKEICAQMGQAFEMQMQEVLATPTTGLQKTEALLRFHIQIMLTRFDEWYISNWQWQHLVDDYKQEFLQIRRGYEKNFTGIIEAGMSDGSMAPIHPQVAVLTLLSAIRGLEFWQRNPHGLDAGTMEEEMIKMLLKALTP